MNTKTPSEAYNLPVIGKIFCKLTITFNDEYVDSPIDEYEVIQVIEIDETRKNYICNSWNSTDIPQMVPSYCVIKFEEY